MQHQSCSPRARTLVAVIATYPCAARREHIRRSPRRCTDVEEAPCIPVNVELPVLRFFDCGLGRPTSSVTMPDPTQRLFSRPVAFPFAGSEESMQRVTDALQAAPADQPLGRVVRGEVSGSHGRSVGGGWSRRVARYADDPVQRALPAVRQRVGKQTPSGAGARSGDAPGSGATPDGGGEMGSGAASGVVGTPQGDSGPQSRGVNDDPSDLGDAPPPVMPATPVAARRSKRRAKAPPSLSQLIEEAVVPCLQRAAGLPSSTARGRDSARVTASIVGQQGTRSRAIVLRYGPRRDQSAILWVSARGGLLCSCFEGTQNAAFLSVSSRSSSCVHARVINKCLSIGKVPVEKLRKRMGLRRDAEDFGVPRVFDSSLVMYVLYQRVYSIVTFTAQSAICVAPGCRSFSRRCGHVRVARRVREELKLNDVGAGPASKAKGGVKERVRFLTNEEEDDGLEKQPSDTIRADGDSPEGDLCRRTRRNLLPCSGEVTQAEVWARTADWRGMQEQTRKQVGATSHLDTMEVLFTSAVKRGLVEDVTQTLVEPRCGSCGMRRTAEHQVTEESALLYHHHPSAAALHVRLLPFCLQLHFFCLCG